MGRGKRDQREKGSHRQPEPTTPGEPVTPHYLDALLQEQQQAQQQQRTQGIDYHSARQRNVWPLVRFASKFARLLGSKGGVSGLSTLQRSMFNVRCSTFDVQRSMFNVRCSTFDVQRSMFFVGCWPRGGTLDMLSLAELRRRFRSVHRRRRSHFWMPPRANDIGPAWGVFTFRAYGLPIPPKPVRMYGGGGNASLESGLLASTRQFTSPVRPSEPGRRWHQWPVDAVACLAGLNTPELACTPSLGTDHEMVSACAGLETRWRCMSAGNR